MEIETAGPLTIYHEAPNSDLSSLSFYPDNRYTVLEDNANVKIQSNLTHVDFIWGSFDDLSGDVNYETRVRKDDNIMAPWESVGLRNSASRKIYHAERADTFFVDVRAINNGGYQSPTINASIILDNRPPILTGIKLNIVLNVFKFHVIHIFMLFHFVLGVSATYLNDKGVCSIEWTNVFSPSVYGPMVYQVSAGSSNGSSDIQSPISTKAEIINIEWSPDQSQHEMFVNILAFGSNGEFSRYNTKFFVR